MPERPAYGWPRGLHAPEAAAYVGISPTTFLGEVQAGRAPKPVQITPGRKIWLRDDLDAWLDRAAGRAPASAPTNPWLAPRGAR